MDAVSWLPLCADGGATGLREAHAGCVVFLPETDEHVFLMVGGFRNQEAAPDDTVVALTLPRSLSGPGLGAWRTLQAAPQGSLPSREGASMTAAASPSGDVAIIFGGMNDAYEPTAETRSLRMEGGVPRCHSIDTPGPPPRWRHTACAAGGTVFIFGGEGRNAEALSDLWSFDVVSGSWRSWTVAGHVPSPRWLSALLPLEHNLILAGGARIVSGRLESLDEVCVLRVDGGGSATGCLSTQRLPHRVNGAVAAATGKKAWLLGGKNLEEGDDDVVEFRPLGAGGPTIVRRAPLASNMTPTWTEDEVAAATSAYTTEEDDLMLERTSLGVPHWRYMAAGGAWPLADGGTALVVVGGQCRHNDVVPAFACAV